MRDYERCRELLSLVEGAAPGYQRLLGLAAGHLREYPAALQSLARARSEEPGDPLLPLSLLSAELASGADPEVPGERSGPLGELAAAAEWRRAQELLRAGEPLRAARAFAEASNRFREASPSAESGERLAAAYLGQVIAYLAADQLDAVQQSFSRIRTAGELPPGVLEFARQVHELADATRTLSPAERSAALAPLVEMLLQVRLRVRFYDGTLPVAMYWEGLPA